VLTDFSASNYPVTDPTFQQKAYTITNTSLTFAPGNGKYSVTVYGKNLDNTLYKQTVYLLQPYLDMLKKQQSSGEFKAAAVQPMSATAAVAEVHRIYDGKLQGLHCW